MNCPLNKVSGIFVRSALMLFSGVAAHLHAPRRKLAFNTEALADIFDCIESTCLSNYKYDRAAEGSSP